MATDYRVVLGGELKPGWTLESASEALAKLMKCDVAKAQGIIANGPVKLKKPMTMDMAEKYKVRIEQAGVCCNIESVEPQGLSLEMGSQHETATAAAMSLEAGSAPVTQQAASMSAAGTQGNEMAQPMDDDEDLDDEVDFGSEEVKKLLKNTYMLLSATLFFSVITAAIGMSQDIANVSGLLIFVISLVLLGITYATRNSVAGLVSIFAFTGWMGYWMGPIISFYLMFENGAELVATAGGLTTLVFLSLSGYVLKSKRDFSFLGSFLFAGLVVVVGGLLISLFFNIPGFVLAISVVGVLVFSGYILYDTSQMIHGGETNYIMATVNLYLDIINLFLHLLRILAALAGED